MKLLVIGTDKTIFSEGSEARKRVTAYSVLFQEVHTIVFTPRGFPSLQITKNSWLYPTNSRFLFSTPLAAVRIGLDIVRRRSIDIVSVQDPTESGLTGWLLKKKTGLPLHVQIHADVFSPFFRKNSWKEFLRYILALFIIPRADAFRVVSQRIARSLKFKFKIKESKITILPIFVDRQHFALSKPVFDLRQKYPQFDFLVLVVARLVREKNIALALAAFKRFLIEFPKSGLVIVGDGPEHKKLKVQSEKLKIAASVRFEGWQEDLVSYYKTADLYLLTSNFEGYGRTVIEAAAAGTPIIMTDVGVAGEIIRDGETGRVVPVGDLRALAAALTEARRDYPAMRRMAVKAQELVLTLPPLVWEEYLEKYRDSFQRLE